MATRGRGQSESTEPEPWFVLGSGVRDLENRQGNSLRVNITTNPTESWGWSDDDVVVVRVEEHRESGKRRVVVTEP